MKNLGNIENPKDLVTKEYVDNKKKVIVSETPPEDTSAIWVKPSGNTGVENPTPAEPSQVNTQANAYQPKDTGWYDITAETIPPDNVEVQGRILLRRIDNVVWLAFDSYWWKNGTNNQNKQNFFSQKLTEYTRPPKMSNNKMMRMGTSVVTGDRRDIVITFDWLFPNNIRMIFYYPYFSTHGSVSWLTDTPFPENPVGIKEEVEI